jgi:hypothetical protein
MTISLAFLAPDLIKVRDRGPPPLTNIKASPAGGG